MSYTQAADVLRSRVLALGVVLLAALLRWFRPALVDYSYDEAHTVGMAQGIAALNGYFPLLSGGTSLGVQRSAFDAYLLAVPLWLTGGRIEAAVWGFGALGVVAVALTYVLGRRVGQRFDMPACGFLAALYMAANPWLVLFDRRLWAHIQVVFSVGLLLLAWNVIVTQRGWAAFAFPIVAALQLLSHVLALLQGLSWLGALLIAPGRWRHRTTAYGMGAALLLLLPYGWAAWQQMRQAGPPARNVATLLDWPAPWWEHLLDPHDWTAARQLVTGSGIASTVGQTELVNPWWRWNMTLVTPLVLILLLVGGVYMLWCARRADETGRGARLLLAWTIGPLLVLALQPMPVFLHYWTVLLPLPALYFAVGVGAVRVLARGANAQRVAGSLAGVAVCGIVVLWLGSYATLQGAIARGEGGIPLRAWQEAVTAARNLAQEAGTEEVRVAVRGVDPGYDSEAAVVATLIGNPPYARFVAPTSPPALLLSHARPSLYFWVIDAPETEAQLAQRGTLVREVPLSAARAPVRLYRLPPAQELDLDFTQLDPAPVFDVGMQLIGYRFPDPAPADQPFSVTLVWRVLDPPWAVRERDFTAFNHILDRAGEMAAQTDGLALLSRDWWPGDVLIQPYTVQLPAGEYTWRVGLYSRVDGGRALTDAGSDAVDLAGLVVQ